MANYNVNITNGVGSQQMKSGNYTVTVNAAGFDSETLTPKTFTALDSAQTTTFTVAASGTLTLAFNETGAEGGTPITSGTVQMTDALGTTTYGSPVTIQNDGSAVFQNVPFGDGTTPYQLYFIQTESDETHNPFVGIISVSMASQTNTFYVQNSLQATQTFNLNDANYGLPVPSATLIFNE